MSSQSFAASLMLLATALSACATPWHKPGGTKAEFEQTLSACQLEAQRAVPPAVAYYVSPESSYSAKSCDDHDRRCAEFSTDTPSAMTPYDANAPEREQYVRACLFKHGWTDDTH